MPGILRLILHLAGILLRIVVATMHRSIERIVDAAEVEPRLASGGTGAPQDVTPHTLRHSVAYRITQEEGRPLGDAQLRLRHANRATADQIYSHPVPR